MHSWLFWTSSIWRSTSKGSAPPILDFRVLESVHFARFVVLPANSEGKRHLVFFDGVRRSSAVPSDRAREAGQRETRWKHGSTMHCADFSGRCLPGSRDAAFRLSGKVLDSLRRDARRLRRANRRGHSQQDALREFIQERLDAARAKEQSRRFFVRPGRRETRSLPG